jgi:hypothetical protein
MRLKKRTKNPTACDKVRGINKTRCYSECRKILFSRIFEMGRASRRGGKHPGF